jgi:hypothetical protein
MPEQNNLATWRTGSDAKTTGRSRLLPVGLVSLGDELVVKHKQFNNNETTN